MKRTRTPRARFAAALLSTSVIATGAMVATAPAAQAASKVTFCFDWPSGKPFSHHNAYLVKKVGDGGVRVARTMTDGNGCGSFSGLRTDRTYWVKASLVKRTANSVLWFAGRTPKVAKPGAGTVWLGTGKVRLVRGISAVSRTG